MMGELATAVEARANVVYLMMNDRGHGVILDHRRTPNTTAAGAYADILTPDFGLVCQSVGLPHQRIVRIADFVERSTALCRRRPVRG